MSAVDKCWGHSEREARESKIKKLLETPVQFVDESSKILIKKGSLSKETSLKEREDMYANSAAWRTIENGGLLSIPVEEFRMIKNQIESYPIAQTVSDMNEIILDKYTTEIDKAMSAGKSKAAAENAAQVVAKKLPESTAVQKWLDNKAEIKLKKALEKMMTKLEIPALIFRSLSLKAISALKDFGLTLSGDAEIDLVVAYVSGDYLHLVICEVKRADTYPWQKDCSLPNGQAVKKAENQLTKDVEVMMTILTGLPPSQIIVHTLACFPEASSLDLETIFCSSCLETGIISQEDLADLSLLQKKTQVPDKPDP